MYGIELVFSGIFLRKDNNFQKEKNKSHFLAQKKSPETGALF
jgi:hypothetical protein